MVEGVNNVVPQNQVSNKDNTVRNTAIATSVGAVGGGVTGWMTKKIFKDNDFTDEFVKSYREKALRLVSKSTKESTNCSIDYINLLESDRLSVKKVKKFIEKHAEVLNKMIPETYEKLSKSPDSELLEAFKKSIPLDGFDKESFKQKLLPLFDSNKKRFRFVGVEEPNDDPVVKTIKSSINELKVKSAVKWAAGVAAVLGLGTYAISKLTGSKEEG